MKLSVRKLYKNKTDYQTPKQNCVLRTPVLSTFTLVVDEAVLATHHSRAFLFATFTAVLKRSLRLTCG